MEDLFTSNRGLFVFSDPGGAKAIIALVKLYGEKLERSLFISDRHYDFFDDFKIKVARNHPDIKIDFLKFKPDFVFCATSYTSQIELEYIQYAKMLKLPTFSFIDHWTSLNQRFRFKDRIIYPDTIFVIDERALEIGKQEGIPENKLKVFENPYWTYLDSWKPTIPKKVFFERIGLQFEEKMIVLYAPEPLSNVNGKERFGVDEIEETEKLSELLLAYSNKDFLFLLKPHPNQNMEKLRLVLNDRLIVLGKQVDANTLIYYSDLVIGFFSNFLIEAEKIGKPVIRLMKNAKEDPLSALGVGEILSLEELKQRLN